MRKHGIRPNKRLGQNFMVDAGALQRVVDAAVLVGTETVVEVGAGLGGLTFYLAQQARQVIAVEIDRSFIPALDDSVGTQPNVRIVVGDILGMDLNALVGGEPYCVVANIPYAITSLLIRRLLETPSKADRLVLTIQREVAERIVAAPGELSLLALSVQLYGQPRIMGYIPAGAFYPRPKVESAILSVAVHETSILEEELIGPLFSLARAGFGQKRKQLHNALKGGLGVSSSQVEAWLAGAGIQSQRRAQELSLEDWGRLASVAAPDLKREND